MSREAMKHIKTWSERCEEHPDHQQGMVSKSMIQARMQEEIDELRQALETEPVVCNKDHSKGYEDFEGKCLLCVIDKLMVEIGDLLIQKCAAEEREWVGLTVYEIQEIHSGNQHWGNFACAIEAKLKEKNT